MSTEVATPPGSVLATSVSRAASFTGSPMTVYSKRSSAPTFPATTVPATTPMPARLLREVAGQPIGQATGGVEGRSGRVVEGDRRAEHRQRAVPLELVHPTVVLVDHLHGRGEELVQDRHHLGRRPAGGQLGRGHEVDEEHGGLADLATQAARDRERLLGDVGAHVASEEVAEALSFAQPDDHAVEPTLELTDLGGVVERDRGVEVTPLDPRDRFAQVTDGIEHRLHRDAVEQPPDQQRRRADDEDGHRELGRGCVVAGEREHGDEHETDDGDRRPQTPRHQAAIADAGDDDPAGRDVAEGASSDGPKDALARQVGDGADDESDEHGRERDRRDGLGLQEPVEQREHHRTAGPEHGMDLHQLEGQSYRRAGLLLGRRAALERPAEVPDEPPCSPQRADGDGNRHVDRHGDRVHGQAELDARRDRDHPGAHGHRDQGPDQVRPDQDDGQQRLDEPTFPGRDRARRVDAVDGSVGPIGTVRVVRAEAGDGGASTGAGGAGAVVLVGDRSASDVLVAPLLTSPRRAP